MVIRGIRAKGQRDKETNQQRGKVAIRQSDLRQSGNQCPGNQVIRRGGRKLLELFGSDIMISFAIFAFFAIRLKRSKP
jgi:hypothetical protein